MGTKLLLMALSCACGMLTGLFFSNSLKSKRDFYCELAAFVSSLISDITFRQDGVRAVAESCRKSGKSRLTAVLEQYIADPGTTPQLNFLPKNERQTVSGFFKGLGKSDIVTEKSEIESTKLKIEELSSSYRLKCAKQSPMYLKLGLLGGLAVGILML